MFQTADDRPQTTNNRPSSTVHGYLRPYFAVPFGDMMIAGCFGLLAATAEVMPNLAEITLTGWCEAGTDVESRRGMGAQIAI